MTLGVVKKTGERFTFFAAQNLLERHGSLSSHQLAFMLESCPGLAVPPALHTYLIRHLRGEVKHKRGRKARDPAIWDFVWHDAHELYQAKLAACQKEDRIGKASAKADRIPPQQRALNAVLKEMPDRFRNIGWERLRNILSEPPMHPCPMDD